MNVDTGIHFACFLRVIGPDVLSHCRPSFCTCKLSYTTSKSNYFLVYFLSLWECRLVTNLSNTIPRMAPEEQDRLMKELLEWCKAVRGRQKALAEELNVTEQTLSNWLHRRKNPSLEYWFALQDFSKKKRLKRQ